jgi:hypothetical protein
MRQEYALDKIIQYSVYEIDNDIKVVNNEYNNITYRIRKEREKLSRRKAKLYEHEQQNPMQSDENENKNQMKTKLELIEKIGQIEQEIESMINKRKLIPHKISLSQMPESLRYNRLNKESKALQNIIKMICYRAETALASLLSNYYKRANQEIRALIKSIIKTPIDMEINQEQDNLMITLYPLSNLRSNIAVSKICDTLNNTNTIYPGTNLRIIYKIATL